MKVWWSLGLFAVMVIGASAQMPEPPPDAPPPDTAPAEKASGAAAPEEALEDHLIDLEVVGAEEPLAVKPADGELITVSLDQVPMQDVVRMFTRISGANIVSGTNLQGSVTVSLRDVEWEPALRVILDSVDMVLVEKNEGIYSIMARDEMESQPVTVDTIFLNYTTVSNVLPVVKQMMVSSNASASAFASANAIVVQETAERLTSIRETVAKLDVPRRQVFVEAKFVELNDQAIKDLGINWQVLEGYRVGLSQLGWEYTAEREYIDRSSDTYERYDERSRSDTLNKLYDIYGDSYQEEETEYEEAPPGSGNVITSTKLEPTRELADTISIGEAFRRETEDTFNRTINDVRTAVLSADEFALTLSALRQNDGISVVSNPKILVASGETAEIHVGTEEPNVRVLPPSDEKNSYTYELDTANPIKIGVQVLVTPVVNTRSNISVRIAPELSRKLYDKEMGGDARVTFPVMSKRRVTTDFSLMNGHTASIGGLTQTHDEEIITKVPLLGDIPIIGKYFFTHTHKEKRQDEVVIFVTVSVAEPDTMREDSGIPSDGRLIHKHLIMRNTRGKDYE